MRLPDMSGMDLTRRVLERAPDCPVLFASGDRTLLPPDLAGARFIQKPFGADKLCEAIASLLTGG